jgi:hypothetical protein
LARILAVYLFVDALADIRVDSARDAEVAWFRGFVAASRWRFAHTYVESYPHEYTLQAWGDGDEFERAVLCIERWGLGESFWRAERKYLYVDDHKYWHMGIPGSDNPEERPTLINRTWLDVSRYRDEARALGHDGDALERMVERWTLLLDRAKQAR